MQVMIKSFIVKVTGDDYIFKRCRKLKFCYLWRSLDEVYGSPVHSTLAQNCCHFKKSSVAFIALSNGQLLKLFKTKKNQENQDKGNNWGYVRGRVG